jgi:hypothetical protein
VLGRSYLERLAGVTGLEIFGGYSPIRVSSSVSAIQTFHSLSPCPDVSDPLVPWTSSGPTFDRNAHGRGQSNFSSIDLVASRVSVLVHLHIGGGSETSEAFRFYLLPRVAKVCRGAGAK